MGGPGRQEAWRARAWLGLVLVVVALVYAPALTGGFVWDDYTLIHEERLVTSPQGLGEYFGRFLWSGPLQSSRVFYRPLITLSYVADHQLWRGAPGGFHLTNLLLHLLATCLVWGLVRRAGRTGDGQGGLPALSAALAAAFALAPRLTESVAWISGRTDVAAALGGLGAFLVHRPGPGAWGRKLAAAGLLLFGLLCKEVAIAGLSAVLVLELHHRFTVRDRWRAVLARVAPALAALAIYAGLRLRAAALDATAPVAVAELDWRTPAAVAVAFSEAVGRYATMLLDPFRPRLQMGLIGYPSAAFCLLGAALLLLAGAAGGRWLLSRRPSRLPGSAWAALALAGTGLGLVVHLLPLNVNAVASDWFLYFPIAGLVVAAAPAAGALWARRPRLVALAAGLLVASFAATTTLRAMEWADELRLWRNTIQTTHPRNVFGQLSLAHALMQRSRWADALARLREVTRVQPSYQRQPSYRGNLALCLDKLGQRSAAIAMLVETTRSHPEQLRLHYHLLMAHARDAHFDRAREVAREIQRRFPGDEHGQELLRVVARAEKDLAALPPARPDEPVETRAARAAIYAALAAPAEAAPLWASVAAAASTPAHLRDQAIGYLVSQAAPTFAAQVLDQLERAPPAGVDLALYRSVLLERQRNGE